MMEGGKRDPVILLVEFTDVWESTPEGTKQVVGSHARDNKSQGKRISACLKAALRVIEDSLRHNDGNEEQEEEEVQEEPEAESDDLSDTRIANAVLTPTCVDSSSSSSSKRMAAIPDSGVGDDHGHQNRKDCRQHTEEGSPYSLRSRKPSKHRGDGIQGSGQGEDFLRHKRKRARRQKENRPRKKTTRQVSRRASRKGEEPSPPDGYSEQRTGELLRKWNDKHLGTAPCDNDGDEEGVKASVVVYEGNPDLRKRLRELNTNDENLLERLKEEEHIHSKTQQLTIRAEFHRGKSYQLLFLAHKRHWEKWLTAHPRFGKPRTARRAKQLYRELGPYTRFQHLEGVSVTKLRKNLPHIAYYLRTHADAAKTWRSLPGVEENDDESDGEGHGVLGRTSAAKGLPVESCNNVRKGRLVCALSRRSSFGTTQLSNEQGTPLLFNRRMGDTSCKAPSIGKAGEEQEPEEMEGNDCKDGEDEEDEQDEEQVEQPPSSSPSHPSHPSKENDYYECPENGAFHEEGLMESLPHDIPADSSDKDEQHLTDSGDPRSLTPGQLQTIDQSSSEDYTIVHHEVKHSGQRYLLLCSLHQGKVYVAHDSVHSMLEAVMNPEDMSFALGNLKRSASPRFGSHPDQCFWALEDLKQPTWMAWTRFTAIPDEEILSRAPAQAELAKQQRCKEIEDDIRERDEDIFLSNYLEGEEL